MALKFREMKTIELIIGTIWIAFQAIILIVWGAALWCIRPFSYTAFESGMLHLAAWTDYFRVNQ